MAKSDYLENKLLDHVLGNSAFSAPATIYVALFTAAPNDAGGGTEVSGTDYARVAVTNNGTNWPAASGGSKSNGVEIDFGTAGAGGWGTVTHVALFDASSGGNMLYHGALDENKSVAEGDSFKFGVGNLTITES